MLSAGSAVHAVLSQQQDGGVRMARNTRVVGGVDTHADTHTAAVIGTVGRVVGSRQFPAGQAGCVELLGWLRRHGRVQAVGVEGTGSYGAGLARLLTEQRVLVVEVDPARPHGPSGQGQARPGRCRGRRPGGAGHPGQTRAPGARLGLADAEVVTATTVACTQMSMTFVLRVPARSVRWLRSPLTHGPAWRSAHSRRWRRRRRVVR